MAVTIGAQSSGVQNSSALATQTINLPTYSSGDILILIVTRNQADASPWTSDANASITQIGVAGARRIVAFIVAPAPSATSFVLTANTTGIWQYVCFNMGTIATSGIPSNGSDIGNNTTSAIAVPAVNFGYTATGAELSLAIGATNSTATWTTDGNTVFSSGAQPGLLVSAQPPTAGTTSQNFTDLDRGLSGTNRYETALSLTLALPASNTKNPLFFQFF